MFQIITPLQLFKKNEALKYIYKEEEPFQFNNKRDHA